MTSRTVSSSVAATCRRALEAYHDGLGDVLEPPVAVTVEEERSLVEDALVELRPDRVEVSSRDLEELLDSIPTTAATSTVGCRLRRAVNGRSS